MALPINTGDEAFETAIKAARRWAYEVKKVEADQAEIITCIDNFHGRTLATVSLSSEEKDKNSYGPILPGFKLIPYGRSEERRVGKGSEWQRMEEHS